MRGKPRTKARVRACGRARPTHGWSVVITTKTGTAVKGPYTKPQAEFVKRTLHPSLIKHSEVVPMQRQAPGLGTSHAA